MCGNGGIGILFCFKGGVRRRRFFVKRVFVYDGFCD